jgi:hypothetical protein
MTRLRLHTDDLHWREVDDEIVALEGHRSKYLAANGSGALLWRMLAEGATRDELAAALAEAYGIDAGVAAADADRFVEQLRIEGLLAA